MQDPNRATLAGGAVEQSTRMAKRAALSGFLGSTIEYFDFVIFASASALVFNKVFFGALGGTGSTIASLATFGVAYVARPLGAIVFGSMGDRVGRAKALVATLLLMGIATFLVGCLPTAAQIGVAAPIMLVVLRLAQGLSAGGEQAGSNTLSTEHAPHGKRGLYTGWTMIGVSAGTMLGSAAFIPVTAFGQEFLLSWGWRLPFLLAGPLMLFTLYIRRQVKEPESFQRVRSDEAREKTTATRLPVVEVLRDHWRNVLRVVFCSLFAVTGSMMSVYAVTYGVQTVGLDASVLLSITSVLGLMMIPISPLWAMLSDRIGRRPVFILCVLGIAAVFPLVFWAISLKSYPLIVVGMIALQVLGAGGNIVQAPFYTEMFPTRVRYTGYAIGTQVGLILVGFSPAIAAAIVQPGPFGWVPVVVFIAVAMVVAAVSAYTAKETRHLTLEEVDGAGAVQEPSVSVPATA